MGMRLSEVAKPVEVGAIGAGMVMQIAHLPAIAQCSSLRLAAVADLDEPLAKSVADRNGCNAVYASHAQLLEHSRVQAVVVVTHRSLTPTLVSDALRAGKHVLSEKPMALSLRTARKLVDLAASRGLVYAVGFMKRYDEGVQRAKALLAELLATRRLGGLVHVCCRNFCAEYVGICEDYVRSGYARQGFLAPGALRAAMPEWLDDDLARRYDWFANVGLHTLNLLRFLLDDRLVVRDAALRYENAASVLLEARGAPVALNLGRAATGRWEETLEFFFERGRLEVALTSLKQRDRCASVVLDENGQGGRSVRHGHDALSEWCFTRQMRAFAEALIGSDHSLLSTAEDSLRDMELLEEIFMKGQEK